jgi:hypothetical protein
MAGPFQGSDLNPALDKSGQGGSSPRCYSKHQRHRLFARVRTGADQLSAFLAATAARLGGGAVTTAVVFAKVAKYGAARVKAATNISQLP